MIVLLSGNIGLFSESIFFVLRKDIILLRGVIIRENIIIIEEVRRVFLLNFTSFRQEILIFKGSVNKMVSNREVHKYIPERIYMPNSRYQILCPSESSLRRYLKEIPVICDLRKGKFALLNRNREMLINGQEDLGFRVERIEVSVPREVFHKDEGFEKFYFNIEKGVWVGMDFMDVPVRLQHVIDDYVVNVFEKNIKEYNRNAGKKHLRPRKSKRDELARSLVNRLFYRV